MLGEINELPEPISISSNEHNEDYYWKQEYQNLQTEFEYFCDKHRNTLARIQSLSFQFEEVQNLVDPNTRSILENLNDELKSIYKITRHSRTSSFNIEGTMNLKISPKTKRKLLFDDIPVESETNEELEIIEKLREENIRLNKMVLELKKKSKDGEWAGKGQDRTEFFGVSEVLRKEAELLKVRNDELEKKIDQIGRMEAGINEYYRNAIPNVLGYHKRLFEGFVKKVNFLQDKENRVLAVFHELKEEVDQRMLENNYWWKIFVIFVIFAIGAKVFLNKVGSKVQYS